MSILEPALSTFETGLRLRSIILEKDYCMETVGSGLFAPTLQRRNAVESSGKRFVRCNYFQFFCKMYDLTFYQWCNYIFYKRYSETKIDFNSAFSKLTSLRLLLNFRFSLSRLYIYIFVIRSHLFLIHPHLFLIGLFF